MTTHKHIDLICVVIFVCMLLLTVLFMNGTKFGLVPVSSDEEETGGVWFTDVDRNADWDMGSVTQIRLEEDGSHVSGQGAYAFGGDVVISNTGFYEISGSTDNGRILVDADSTSKVFIRLCNAELSCGDDACLQVLQADKVVVTLPEGSENRLERGGAASADAQASGRDGAVFAQDDLTFNGSGTLTISGGYRHGIEAKDDLVITGGSFEIDAAEDAVSVNDSFRTCDADLSLSAGDDGITVRQEWGYFYMESGSLSIQCREDAISSAGKILFAGGTLDVEAGDDAIHSDLEIAVSGGQIRLASCYEGIEAPIISIDGGEIDITPDEDGIHAGYPEEAGEILPTISISGGSVRIVNGTSINAEGLDSDGDICISGGVILISMADGEKATAVDADGNAEISGGTMLAGGSVRKTKLMGGTQPSLICTYKEGMPDETEVILTDETGNTLVSGIMPCGFSALVISAMEMQPGAQYTLKVGDTETRTTISDGSTVIGDEKKRVTENSEVSGEADAETETETTSQEVPEEAAETAETEQTESNLAAEPYPASVWLILGTMLLVLALGILFVRKVPKY